MSVLIRSDVRVWMATCTKQVFGIGTLLAFLLGLIVPTIASAQSLSLTIATIHCTGTGCVGLPNYTPAAGVTEIYAQGYSAPGDGGEGEFYWNSALTSGDNGVVICPATSGCWVRTNVDAITPRWWGAKCNGTGDDTSAIQSAISWSDSNHRTVALPAGNCVISDNLNIQTDGQRIVCAGPLLTTISWTGSVTADMVSFTPRCSDSTARRRDRILRHERRGHGKRPPCNFCQSLRPPYY